MPSVLHVAGAQDPRTGVADPTGGATLVPDAGTDTDAVADADAVAGADADADADAVGASPEAAGAALGVHPAMTRIAIPRRMTRILPRLATLAFVVALARNAAAEESAPDTAWSPAIFLDVTTAFVPIANDVPIMLGLGVRFAKIHEVWARAGTMPTGDDVGLTFGAFGYRAALRPGKVVRPIFGGLVAGLPKACGHDANGTRVCEDFALFIFAATAGVRFEPTPWLGLFAEIALGIDSYPNPFGMVEGGVSFTIPAR